MNLSEITADWFLDHNASEEDVELFSWTSGNSAVLIRANLARTADAQFDFRWLAKLLLTIEAVPVEIARLCARVVAARRAFVVYSQSPDRPHPSTDLVAYTEWQKGSVFRWAELATALDAAYHPIRDWVGDHDSAAWSLGDVRYTFTRGKGLGYSGPGLSTRYEN